LAFVDFVKEVGPLSHRFGGCAHELHPAEIEKTQVVGDLQREV
jgi:hypothetical protein